MDRTREILQGAIAMTVVLGAVGVTVADLVMGRPLENIPAWLTGLIGVIAGFYFGQSSMSAGVSKGSNGVVQAARQIVQAQQPQDQAAAATITKPEVK